jgi:hypothetical protein
MFAIAFTILPPQIVPFFLLFVTPMAYVALLLSSWGEKSRLHRHIIDLEAFAAAQNYSFDAVGVKPYRTGFHTLAQIEGARHITVRNYVAGNDWLYAEISYEIRPRSRGSEYHAATVYYGVMSTPLPRKLPHVFFDSIKARRRQFRFHFARSQRQSLEGDFDKHFVTYVPEGYHIDGLSFISPDVMLKLRDAGDYDTEILGDQLVMYGPLGDPTSQLPDMAAKLAAIKQELLDNILTYRDQRLPYELGRKMVAGGGMALRRSRFWAIVGTIATVVYILIRFGVPWLLNQ